MNQHKQCKFGVICKLADINENTVSSNISESNQPRISNKISTLGFLCDEIYFTKKREETTLAYNMQINKKYKNRPTVCSNISKTK